MNTRMWNRAVDIVLESLLRGSANDKEIEFFNIGGTWKAVSPYEELLLKEHEWRHNIERKHWERRNAKAK